MGVPLEKEVMNIDFEPLKVIKPDGSQSVLTPGNIKFSSGVEIKPSHTQDIKGATTTSGLVDGPEVILTMKIHYADGSTAFLDPCRILWSDDSESILHPVDLLSPAGFKIFSASEKHKTLVDSHDTDGSEGISSSDSEDAPQARVLTPSGSESSLVSSEGIDLNDPEVSLQHAESIHCEDFNRPILNILKATLQYRASPELKSIKLADDINFICTSADARGAPGRPGNNNILWIIWMIVLDLARCIPADHPWQDSLVLALERLRRQQGDIHGNLDNDNPASLWECLPDLGWVMREQWLGPYVMDKDEVDRWKNLNSFAARLSCPEFFPWINFPIWEIRAALEEPHIKGPDLEYQMWVASEWFKRCAGVLYQGMATRNETDKSTARSLRGGSLCDGITPISLERWDFWKSRFSQIRADAGDLELDNSILDRISDALENMDAVENPFNRQPLQLEVVDRCPVCADKTCYPNVANTLSGCYIITYANRDNPLEHFHVEYSEDDTIDLHSPSS